jgi:putative membrane protein insertion efficiency factor
MEKFIRTLKRTTTFFMILFYKTVFQVPQGLCRFYPTCSEYAQQSLDRYPLHRAIVLIAKRFLKCNPLCKGGYDPLPSEIKGGYK